MTLAEMTRKVCKAGESFSTDQLEAMGATYQPLKMSRWCWFFPDGSKGYYAMTTEEFIVVDD
jgi:hypothetical protein